MATLGLNLFLYLIISAFAINVHQVMSQNNCKEQISAVDCQSLQDKSLIVQYGRHLVVCNENLPLNTYSGQPFVAYKQAKQNQNYTLVMVDPDAPSSKSENLYFLHWLVTGINGEDLLQGNLQNVKTVVSYTSPKPPKGSGIHRYQFFVYEQQVANNVTGRAKFDLVQILTNRGSCTPAVYIQFRTQSF